MEKIFCPFIQKDCNPQCIFNSSDYSEKSPENCRLVCATESIQLIKTEIVDNLFSINSNTSSDQTESDSINTILKDIKKVLER